MHLAITLFLNEFLRHICALICIVLHAEINDEMCIESMVLPIVDIPAPTVAILNNFLHLNVSLKLKLWIKHMALH